MTSKWQTRKLGDICNIIGGGTPSKSNAGFYTGEIPWATVRDMKDQFIIDTEHKITQEAVKNSSTNVIPKNNVVIASRVGLGKVCFLRNDTAINQDLRAIIPKNNNELDVHYLFWWFKSIAVQIEKAGTGATVQGIKLPFIKQLEIPLPPIAEQKRIVTKLDRFFSDTDRLEGIYEQKLIDLDELRQSTLKQAFTGKLS